MRSASAPLFLSSRRPSLHESSAVLLQILSNFSFWRSCRSTSDFFLYFLLLYSLTHTLVYWRFGWWHTHTYLYPCRRLIACINTSFFTFTGAFFSHACGDTRNLRTYFTSVRWVFLVETVVLQTVLWDIRAWSTRFRVHKYVKNRICNTELK